MSLRSMAKNVKRNRKEVKGKAEELRNIEGITLDKTEVESTPPLSISVSNLYLCLESHVVSVSAKSYARFAIGIAMVKDEV